MNIPTVTEPTLEEIQAARKQLSPQILRTPTVRLDTDSAPSEIYLKLENLQPIGSFKIRGAGNAIAAADKESLRSGVWTASAGNMAQGVAWHARARDIPCTVVVPEQAAETKLEAITRLGAHILRVPFADWWNILVTHEFPSCKGLFIHPFSNTAVMAGNGTIGLEILEDIPDVDTIYVPYGGGGLACGIAAAVRQLRPHTKIFACEPETAAPLTAAWAASKPVDIIHTPSFVDGAGGRSVPREMWPIASRLLDGSLAVPLHDAAAAIRLLLARTHVLAEGAAALSVAAALAGVNGAGKRSVCVVSGGNIDLAKLLRILNEELL
ncbi:MAG TPA: pyridoxal-phosphate dependent enzyme [Pyrinomonadaceae bacterium]|nr:pyridoxal-phosphate dependent enzyme [Pyrinomonadaceae bacterium]